MVRKVRTAYFSSLSAPASSENMRQAQLACAEREKSGRQIVGKRARPSLDLRGMEG